MNGLRDIAEFTWLGDVAPMPEPDGATDAEWCAYVLETSNGQAKRLEWWLHGPSGYVFVVRRDIVTDTVAETFDPRHLPAECRDRVGSRE